MHPPQRIPCRSALACAWAAVLLGCHGPPERAWSYSIATIGDGTRLAVRAAFSGSDPAFRAFAPGEPRAALFVESVRSRDRALPRQGGRFRLVEPTRAVSIEYEIDLRALADRERGFETAYPAGDAVLSPWTAWLLRPDGRRDDVPVTISFRDAAPESYAFGLDGDRDGLVRSTSQELDRRAYAVFGPVARLGLETARGDRPWCLAIPRGRFALEDAQLSEWVRGNAELFSNFAGGRALHPAMVVLIPIGGSRGSVFGRVEPSPLPTLLLFTGERSTAAALWDDWIPVHEMLHLTFPPVSRRDRWLDEGLATYFDPILRARGGRISEAECLGELRRGLPRGLRALERRGLASARGIDDVYWGGALFCFLADVGARMATSGHRGLEDGVRALAEEGIGIAGPRRDARDLLRLMDRAIGADILETLWRDHAEAGSPVELDRWFEDLGVVTADGSVILTDDAPLARVRRALIRGGTGSRTRYASSSTLLPSRADW